MDRLLLRKLHHSYAVVQLRLHHRSQAALWTIEQTMVYGKGCTSKQAALWMAST